MRGSGFDNILLVAGLIGFSLLEGVHTGKHYARALQSLKWLLLHQYLAHNGEAHLFVLLPTDTYTLNGAVSDIGLGAFIREYM